MEVVEYGYEVVAYIGDGTGYQVLLQGPEHVDDERDLHGGGIGISGQGRDASVGFEDIAVVVNDIQPVVGIVDDGDEIHDISVLLIQLDETLYIVLVAARVDHILDMAVAGGIGAFQRQQVLFFCPETAVDVNEEPVVVGCAPGGFHIAERFGGGHFPFDRVIRVGRVCNRRVGPCRYEPYVEYLLEVHRVDDFGARSDEVDIPEASLLGKFVFDEFVVVREHFCVDGEAVVAVLSFAVVQDGLESVRGAVGRVAVQQRFERKFGLQFEVDVDEYVLEIGDVDEFDVGGVPVFDVLYELKFRRLYNIIA